MKKINPNFRSPSLIMLMAANLVPVYGVIFLDWKVFSLIFLFWLENVFIGFFNVFKMLCCRPQNRVLWFGKLFMIPFFTFHYGMFTAIHGLFVILLFGSGSIEISGIPALNMIFHILQNNHLGYVALMLFISHGFSFIYNYIGKQEYQTSDLQSLMGKPYVRIVVLHISILIGGFLLMALRSPLVGLLLFIFLKTVMDMNAHSKEHKTKETDQLLIK